MGHISLLAQTYMVSESSAHSNRFDDESVVRPSSLTVLLFPMERYSTQFFTRLYSMSKMEKLYLSSGLLKLIVAKHSSSTNAVFTECERAAESKRLFPKYFPQ